MKSSVIILALSLVALTGCKASVPSCDDKEIDSLLSKILIGQGFSLVKNSAITTVRSDDRVRICKSLMTVKEAASPQTEEIGVIYEINLADNGKEFTVNLRAE